VGERRVPRIIKAHYTILVGGGRRQTSPRKRNRVAREHRDLRERYAVRRLLNLEAILIVCIIGPRKIDLAARKRRRGKIRRCSRWNRSDSTFHNSEVIRNRSVFAQEFCIESTAIDV